MEFPAISHTREEFWKEKHYTRNGMWWFTLFFGWFGLHHLLLKSPQTAVLVYFGNKLLLGYPWLYDLIQLSSWGLKDEELELFGMDSPFGALGLAKGMWVSSDGLPSRNTDKNRTHSAKPWAFFFYCLLCPIGIVASLIVGDYGNAMARFFNIFPLSYLMVGYLLEFVCIICDICIVLFKPVELIFGIKRPFLFRSSMMDYVLYPGLTMNKDGFSPNIMPVYFNDTLRKHDKEYRVAERTAKEQAHAQQQAQQEESAHQERGRRQEGGGSGGSQEKTSLDYLAITTMAAIIGGGLLLSAGRSANGLFPDKNDPPPKSRDV
jgi:TM2 domain-containing membrane protein YozV